MSSKEKRRRVQRKSPRIITLEDINRRLRTHIRDLDEDWMVTEEEIRGAVQHLDKNVETVTASGESRGVQEDEVEAPSSYHNSDDDDESEISESRSDDESVTSQRRNGDDDSKKLANEAKREASLETIAKSIMGGIEKNDDRRRLAKEMTKEFDSYERVADMEIRWKTCMDDFKAFLKINVAQFDDRNVQCCLYQYYRGHRLVQLFELFHRMKDQKLETVKGKNFYKYLETETSVTDSDFRKCKQFYYLCVEYPNLRICGWSYDKLVRTASKIRSAATKLEDFKAALQEEQ